MPRKAPRLSRRPLAIASALVLGLVGTATAATPAYALPGWPKSKPNPNFQLAKVPWVTAVPGAPGSSPATSATFKASINPDGSESAYCFDYGLNGWYDTRSEDAPAWKDGETNPAFLPGIVGAIPVVSYVFGLRPGTVYHYTVQVTNAGGDKMTADRTFRTPR